MTGADELRRLADGLVGDAIAEVTYVGLTYDDPSSVAWDFGDWHWPEVAVELTMRSGRTINASWGRAVDDFQLTLAEGPVLWSGRTWSVTQHPRWQPIVGREVTRAGVSARDDPVAVRLATASAPLWIVAAAPREYQLATPDLGTDDVYLGHDEVIVVFTDQRARRIGLPPPA